MKAFIHIACLATVLVPVSVDRDQILPVVKQKGDNLTLHCIFSQSVEWRCQWKIGKIFNGTEFITKSNNDLEIINLNNSGICGCYHGSRDAPIAEYNITAEEEKPDATTTEPVPTETSKTSTSVDDTTAVVDSNFSFCKSIVAGCGIYLSVFSAAIGIIITWVMSHWTKVKGKLIHCGNTMYQKFSRRSPNSGDDPEEFPMNRPDESAEPCSEDIVNLVEDTPTSDGDDQETVAELMRKLADETRKRKLTERKLAEEKRNKENLLHQLEECMKKILKPGSEIGSVSIDVCDE